MKKYRMRMALVFCLVASLFTCALPASATAIDTSGLPEAVVLNTDPSSSEAQVYQDGTRLIANDIVCGEEVFQMTARFRAVNPPSETPLYTTFCVGFAYQNGNGTFGSNPHFSFYQFRMELKGEENNAFVQLQKQVDDTDYSRIKPVTVDGEGQGAAEDGFYVTADNGWDTNAEEGFVLTATVDLPNNLAVCEIEGLTTGTKGTMTVDLTTKAVGERDTLHTLGAGGIFVDFDSEWVTLEELAVAGEEIPAEPVTQPTGDPTSDPTTAPTGGSASQPDPDEPDSPETGEPVSSVMIAAVLAVLALAGCGSAVLYRKRAHDR